MENDDSGAEKGRGDDSKEVLHHAAAMSGGRQ